MPKPDQICHATDENHLRRRRMSKARQGSWGSTRDPSSTKDLALLAVLSHQNVSFTLTEYFILPSGPPNYREPSKATFFARLLMSMPHSALTELS
jgi:hypothetical protein